jgi:type VI secretion system protein ImpM
VNAGLPGFFGKVTSHGDFVSRRLPPDVVEAWDGWLQQCIQASKEQLGAGWLAHYLTSPVWRFAAAAGVLGEQPWIGVMMPSVDRVGRHFPLMIAAPGLPGTALTEYVSGAMAWFDTLEDLARDTLAADFVLERFDQALAAMPVHEGAAPVAAPAGRRWPIAARDEVPPGVAAQLQQGHSLWWSEGSPNVAPSLLACQGLPGPASFAAMLDGRWQERGWA